MKREKCLVQGANHWRHYCTDHLVVPSLAFLRLVLGYLNFCQTQDHLADETNHTKQLVPVLPLRMFFRALSEVTLTNPRQKPCICFISPLNGSAGFHKPRISNQS